METLKKNRKVIRSQETRFTIDADKALGNTFAVDIEEVEEVIAMAQWRRRSVISGMPVMVFRHADGPWHATLCKRPCICAALFRGQGVSLATCTYWCARPEPEMSSQ
ncbi:hypothetical protein HPB50_008162 [Hyalomma asiaticum]|uniref:Uncharacterized protein n=1 Tax=Hyalomma asiaticum TaxID=266040 RepID=A0ACB7T6K4_HYAAI|nr:hypothetical protein HPB50_008162 [Hyalomma asiaticum]